MYKCIFTQTLKYLFLSPWAKRTCLFNLLALKNVFVQVTNLHLHESETKVRRQLREGKPCLSYLLESLLPGVLKHVAPQVRASGEATTAAGNCALARALHTLVIVVKLLFLTLFFSLKGLERKALALRNWIFSLPPRCAQSHALWVSTAWWKLRYTRHENSWTTPAVDRRQVSQLACHSFFSDIWKLL